MQDSDRRHAPPNVFDDRIERYRDEVEESAGAEDPAATSPHHEAAEPWPYEHRCSRLEGDQHADPCRRSAEVLEMERKHHDHRNCCWLYPHYRNLYGDHDSNSWSASI